MSNCIGSASSLSPLEALPVEIVEFILELLAFFAKKSLQLASRQTHHLVGPIKCPDPLSWIIHICWTARNRGIYDYTMINPYKVAGILKGMSLRLDSTEFVHNIHAQAQTVGTRYCSESIWYPYFPVQYLLQSQENFLFRTLGDFMLSHIRLYLQRALVERRREIERQHGSFEKWRYRDWKEMGAWRDAENNAYTIHKVLFDKKEIQGTLGWWGFGEPNMDLREKAEDYELSMKNLALACR